MPSNTNYRVTVFLSICFLSMEVFSATSSGAEGNLFDAAGEGDLARVKALIEAKADVNAKDTYRATALKYASSAGHVEVVKLLRKAGAKE